MANYREMLQLAENPAGVRSLATYLLALADVGWTDWEVDFLQNMAGWQGPDALSTRQREVLVELRDDAMNYSKFDGFSVASLVRACWLGRSDLTEDDEEFVCRLYDAKTQSLKRRPVLRLLRCARELNLLEAYVQVA